MAERTQLEWEKLKAIIDNFAPQEHAKFIKQIREYLREYGIDVRQKLEELAQSDDVEIAEAAQALIAYYWKNEDER